jgi:hypothetical protein
MNPQVTSLHILKLQLLRNQQNNSKDNSNNNNSLMPHINQGGLY